jgi:hypothetical protein
MDSVERNVYRNLIGSHLEKQTLGRLKWQLECSNRMYRKETGIGDFLSIKCIAVFTCS